MVFNITVEIDWINNDSTVDEVIKKAIADQIISSIMKKNEVNISNLVSDQIKSDLNKKILKEYQDFIKKPMIIYDDYGDKKEEYPSMRDLIKSRFDKFLYEKVNERGHADSYDRKYPRIEYLVKKEIDERTKHDLERAVSDELKKVKDELLKKVNEKVGSKIIELIEGKNG